MAARLRLGVRGVRALRAVQTGGFGCERSAHFGVDAGADSGAGAIREAGGSFAKRAKAEEERYFREQTKEQLAALKQHHEEEITHHTSEIERLQKEIARHKKNIKKLKHNND